MQFPPVSTAKSRLSHDGDYRYASWVIVEWLIERLAGASVGDAEAAQAEKSRVSSRLHAAESFPQWWIETWHGDSAAAEFHE